MLDKLIIIGIAMVILGGLGVLLAWGGKYYEKNKERD